MRRVVSVLVAFGLLWLVPVSPASAETQTALFPALFDDLAPHVAGQPVAVSAILLSDTAALEGMTLTFAVKPSGATTFSTPRTVSTGFDGIATTEVTLDRNAVVRWTFTGDSTYGGSTTEYLVPVSPRVDLRVNDRRLHRGQRFVARGRTFPAKPGCTVKLWRGELRPLIQGPKPVRLAVGKVRSDGTYRLVHRFRSKARMRVAVTVGACAGNERGLSTYVHIRVR